MIDRLVLSLALLGAGVELAYHMTAVRVLKARIALLEFLRPR